MRKSKRLFFTDLIMLFGAMILCLSLSVALAKWVGVIGLWVMLCLCALGAFLLVGIGDDD